MGEAGKPRLNERGQLVTSFLAKYLGMPQKSTKNPQLFTWPDNALEIPGWFSQQIDPNRQVLDKRAAAAAAKLVTAPWDRPLSVTGPKSWMVYQIINVYHGKSDNFFIDVYQYLSDHFFILWNISEHHMDFGCWGHRYFSSLHPKDVTLEVSLKTWSWACSWQVRFSTRCL